MGWPEGDFVRLLFHELAHQVVYAQGDTVFNESFATAVERLGSARWMAEHSTPRPAPPWPPASSAAPSGAP